MAVSRNKGTLEQLLLINQPHPNTTPLRQLDKAFFFLEGYVWVGDDSLTNHLNRLFNII